MISTVTATTSESHNFLVSGLREFQSENTKTLKAIQEVCSGLTPVLTELRSLCFADNELLLGSVKDGDKPSIETRASKSGIPDEITQQLPSNVGSDPWNQNLQYAFNNSASPLRSSQESIGQTSSVQKPLLRYFLDMENVITDVKTQQDCHSRRTRSEQAQQFIQVQQGIEDLRRLFQNMKSETHDLTAEINSVSSPVSLQMVSTSTRKCYKYLLMDIKQL